MRRLAWLSLLAGCAVPVSDYCDAETPCAGPLDVCLQPEHACAPALAWGELSGIQSVPPTPSDLGGSIRIAKNDLGALVYDLAFARQLPAGGRPADFSAHLHAGGPGVAGQVLGALSPGLGALDWLSDDQLIGLYAGQLYVDVHSAAFASSEARAQIWPVGALAGRAEVQATLSPRQEPDPRDVTSSGAATVAYDPGTGTGDYRLRVAGTQGVVAVHLHRGVFGVEGDHFVTLRAPGSDAELEDSFAQDQVDEPIRTLLPGLLMSGVIYVNVHTAAFPTGELRGQLLTPVSGAVATPFAAALSPDQVSPPVASVAQGTASFVLSPDQRWLTFLITHTVVDAGGAVFARGNPGAAVLALPAGQAMGAVPVSATGAAGALPLADLLGGQIYLSVLSQAHPEGELRGRLQLP